MPRYDRWSGNSKQLKTLRESDLFRNRLRDDIRAGIIFPALRPGKADFYFQGRRLFTFDGGVFRTNVKYAVALDQEDGLVTEGDLASLKNISSFDKAYERIKANARLYRDPESGGIADLWSNVSFAAKSSDDHTIVAIDIELSLNAFDRSGQDRIDLVLLSKRTGTLHFVEAKVFSNSEIRPTNSRTPKIVEQIRAYEAQISRRQNELLEDYAQYVEIMNDLFGLELSTPAAVDSVVRLLVFEFSADEQKNRLFPLLKDLQANYQICCLNRGSLRGVKTGTLQKWLKS